MDQTSPVPGNSTDSEKITSLIETPIRNSTSKDYFKELNGKQFAGAHVFADLWGAKHLDDINYIEEGLRKAIEACDATLLHVHLHHFGTGCGVSGVAVLAESHISVHTWPERDFAAFDIFMCGSCNPELALPILQKQFNPKRMETEIHKRVVIG